MNLFFSQFYGALAKSFTFVEAMEDVAFAPFDCQLVSFFEGVPSSFLCHHRIITLIRLLKHNSTVLGTMYFICTFTDEGFDVISAHVNPVVEVATPENVVMTE